MRIQRKISHKPKINYYEQVDLSLIDPLIEKLRDKKGSLIPLLQGTQEIYGFLPREAILKLCSETGHDLSELFGVATFYAQFRQSPTGKHLIKMCHGTACHVLQVSEVTDGLLDYLEIHEGQTTPDRLFTLETVACLGCCSLAPVMMIGDEAHGKLSPQNALKIVKEIRRNEISQSTSPTI
ncbi:MAG TPA: NAD(P)H-dependent oxidoreductase subunit E [Bacteroidales bacterium]|nr:NAD(P)H-dependent oxidoreductase subunit E [Bacteroidales bacterium]